ncbi:ATP-binding protein [Pseudomonas sp. P7759]|uniref:ATP-binding protein n=1 Tax=Pseudomonas sp. P7759 TaxID=2738831 RepID=UPI0015A32FC1|nr:ATP-binding protein [Pseudomonas sp. P7759]NWC78222.1 ATP-binding protein [Pseudomonas sp. P7759]
MVIANNKALHFDVSSGLKSVLGSDLITDDEVAIFELVKNSFDADAKLVSIYFDTDRIIISDNGQGMSYDDIRSKWLFVAYSSKRTKNRNMDFRNDIADRRSYAGSKGIGRFSSDRLGTIVKLQTRPKSEKGKGVHTITVDWTLFDKNHREHFHNITVDYELNSAGFILPHGTPKLEHGTVISIENTRIVWNREKILRLKSALAKLINPFGAATDGFTIKIIAPHEAETDKEHQNQLDRKGETASHNSLVNGDVGNFIFSTLQEKTTFIDVQIDPSGKYIESTLIDRGELIYKIREPNEFTLLENSEFRCQVFFLNQSAKLTFAKRMGVPSVQFGSVFLFRNGFRVFPIGDEGDDWFGMDRRKQQGYARFLGTRDVIGRIDVSGVDSDFQEASSRNTGLIETPAVAELKKCFRDYCQIRLERYVVPVTFVDKEDKNTSDVSRLLTDPGRARVTNAVAKLVDDKNVELLDYSRRLIGILSERSSQFEGSLTSLRAIAEKTQDNNLLNKIDVAEKKFEELRASEERAHKQADEERKAKEAAQERARKAELLVSNYSEKLVEEKKRNLFLSSITTLETDTIINLHHQVTIYSVDIQQQLENFLVKISGNDVVSVSDVINAMDGIALLNRKIMGISKFATKANFRLESEKIEADLGEYIEQYINGVAKDFLSGPISMSVTNDSKGFLQKFKPIDISVVIDNLVSNARRARASKITFEITHPSKNSVHITVADNGRGFIDSIDDLDRIFEKGYTKTDGSGLGLYHVSHVLGEMNGTIEALSKTGTKGASFLIRIAK